MVRLNQIGNSSAPMSKMVIFFAAEEVLNDLLGDPRVVPCLIMDLVDRNGGHAFSYLKRHLIFVVVRRKHDGVEFLWAALLDSNNRKVKSPCSLRRGLRRQNAGKRRTIKSAPGFE
ncbi:MAG: hypothetical protein IPL39_12290 [Opitutaceae bacterium]|nr:hypothetical protein [Opitutaceae bacterium]